MKKYLTEYKPFLQFLASFFITYLLLTFIYQSYLNTFDEKKLEVDGITKIVANNTKDVLLLIDTKSFTEPNTREASVNLFYKNTWVARIIEGCNAINVIILFISFVIAFKGKFVKTILFILAGCLLIYFFNVVRIVLLSMAMFHYPKYQDVLHSVVFPLFIYGIVFLLWVIWVNKFSYYAKKDASK